MTDTAFKKLSMEEEEEEDGAEEGAMLVDESMDHESLTNLGITLDDLGLLEDEDLLLPLEMETAMTGPTNLSVGVHAATGCPELNFAVVFLCQLAIILMIGIVSGLSPSTGIFLDSDLTAGSYLVFFGCVCVAFAAAVMWLIAHLSHTHVCVRKQTLRVGQWLTALFILLTAALLLLFGNSTCVVLGGVLLWMAFIDFLWALANRGQMIERASMLAEAVGGKALMWSALCTMTGMGIFLFAWSLILVEVLRSSSGSFLSYFTLCFLFLSGYWTAQVLHSVMIVTISGTMLFKILSSENGDCILPAHAVAVSTLEFMRRAHTTSFGSVCRAALLVGPSQALWSTLRILSRLSQLCATSSNSKPSALTSRIFELALYVVQHNHGAALSHVAFYGKPFPDAARDTWELLLMRPTPEAEGRGRGHTTSGDGPSSTRDARWQLLKNYFSGHVPFFGPSAVGVFLALAVGLVVWTSSGAESSGVVMALAAFFIGHSLTAIATKAVQAAASAVYVCFAERPSTMQKTHPLIFHRLQRQCEMQAYASSVAEVA